MVDIMYFVAGGIISGKLAEKILTSSVQELQEMKLDCDIAKKFISQRIACIKKKEIEEMKQAALIRKTKRKKKEQIGLTTEEFWSLQRKKRKKNGDST